MDHTIREDFSEMLLMMITVIIGLQIFPIRELWKTINSMEKPPSKESHTNSQDTTNKIKKREEN